ncbi:MAG: nitroreductase [Marinifilaceae bacterium]|jgi:nitroreductase|nr:nitroreductase [Marinifilaceae bacterium]
MSAKETIYKRRATRAFLDKAIPKEELMEVLETTNRTPSWTNSQPWEVFVVSGEKLKNLKKIWQQEISKYTAETMPFNKMDIQFPGYDSWGNAPQAIENMVGFKEKFAKDTGLSQEEFMKIVMESNANFFNAPTIVYLGMKKDLGPYSMFDLGAYQQTLMLAAEDKGLQTCPAGAFVILGDILRRELNIPEDISMALGIAMGYEDKDHLLNKRGPMQRMKIEQYVRIIE